MFKRFNLSEWALAHQALVLYFMIVLALVGVGSYLRLGQAEDPDFTFKLMVVRTMWPGASADEVERQLTDKIEKKLQETPRLDFLRSYSKPGESVVFVFVKDSSRAAEAPHQHRRAGGTGVGREREGARDPRKQPPLPAGRRGHGVPRLRRPGAAAHALHGQGGARHRRVDGVARRHHRPRPCARRR